MKIQEMFTQSAWVTEDGSCGFGEVILFDPDKLTDEQWENLNEMRDNNKYGYVYAILNNEDLSEWED